MRTLLVISCIETVERDAPESISDETMDLLYSWTTRDDTSVVLRHQVMKDSEVHLNTGYISATVLYIL